MAGLLSSLGYLAAATLALLLLPAYAETPSPLVDDRGTIVFPGFPADVLADFRLYSVLTAAVMWLITGAVFAALVPRVLPHRSTIVGQLVTTTN